MPHDFNRSQPKTDRPTRKDRKVAEVKHEGAVTTANTAIAKVGAIETYADSLTAAIGDRVDDAAFQMAAAIATIPAQLANRTQYYLERMGGADAWAQFDQALQAVNAPRSTAEHLLFNSDLFAALPDSELFE